MRGKSSDVVVIGAGVRGTAIAYHLARAGVRVTVVDKGFICSGTSGASFSLINVSGKRPGSYTALSLASADLYPGLSEELGCDLEYERGNQMYSIIEREEDLPGARSYAARQSAVPGISISVLSAQDIRELEPAVSPSVAGALLCDQDGHLNPFKLTFGYAQAATRLGAEFLTYHEVIDIRTEHGKVHQVVTQHGAIDCDWVVNAAGIDVPAIGAMVGLKIPMIPCRGQVVTTEPLPGLLRQPFGSLKPNRAGPILIGTTDEFVGTDRIMEFETVSRLVKRAARIIPALANAKVLRFWTGYRPWPVDALPIMGGVPSVDGYLIATGHSGFTLAQITGQYITDLITTGSSAIPMQDFSAQRFSEGRFAFIRHLYDQYERPDASGQAVAAPADWGGWQASHGNAWHAV